MTRTLKPQSLHRTFDLREADLRQLLLDRRGELKHRVESRMRSETLIRIDAALVRLEAGQYGSCAVCDKPIGHGRLRALPFTMRCVPCEERREQRLERADQVARTLSIFPLLADAV
jgi:RNA polymerase-binding transcription factor DksA